MIFVIIFIILLVILGAIFFISTQNSLVVLDENCKNAFSQIEVNITSRFDALTGLLDCCKGYAEHEYKTLTDVIASRRTGHTIEDVKANENILTEAMGKIMAVQEQYPELKANENYTRLMDSVNGYEDKVRSTRMIFNDSVTKFNRKVRMFPGCLIAGMLGFKVKDEYIEADEKHKEMPSLK